MATAPKPPASASVQQMEVFDISYEAVCSLKSKNFQSTIIIDKSGAVRMTELRRNSKGETYPLSMAEMLEVSSHHSSVAEQLSRIKGELGKCQ